MSRLGNWTLLFTILATGCVRESPEEASQDAALAQLGFTHAQTLDCLDSVEPAPETDPSRWQLPYECFELGVFGVPESELADAQPGPDLGSNLLRAWNLGGEGNRYRVSVLDVARGTFAGTGHQYTALAIQCWTVELDLGSAAHSAPLRERCPEAISSLFPSPIAEPEELVTAVPSRGQ